MTKAVLPMDPNRWRALDLVSAVDAVLRWAIGSLYLLSRNVT